MDRIRKIIFRYKFLAFNFQVAFGNNKKTYVSRKI